MTSLGRPADVPAPAREVATAWGLLLGAELRQGRLGARFEATTAGGAEAVLELWPATVESDRALAALRAWGGRGTPAVLRADDARHVLLERIRPGDPACDASVAEVVTLLSALRAEAPAGLPRLEAVVGERLRQAAADGRAWGPKLAWAWAALDRRTSRAPADGLVHGRLLGERIERCSRRGLCAVDPEPCAGDPAYDAAFWIHGGGTRGRRGRFDALAKAAGLDRASLRDWCGIIAVHG